MSETDGAHVLAAIAKEKQILEMEVDHLKQQVNELRSQCEYADELLVRLEWLIATLNENTNGRDHYELATVITMIHVVVTSAKDDLRRYHELPF